MYHLDNYALGITSNTLFDDKIEIAHTAKQFQLIHEKEREKWRKEFYEKKRNYYSTQKITLYVCCVINSVYFEF